MKYAYYDVLISELPNELTLGFSITGCPIKCKDCHSKHLWNKKLGIDLTNKVLLDIIDSQNIGLSCILFLGGEWNEPELIDKLQLIRFNYKLKTALYSGHNLDYFYKKHYLLNELDYLKVGPYISEYGNLRSKNTNQKLYILENGQIKEDITNLFWR